MYKNKVLQFIQSNTSTLVWLLLLGLSFFLLFYNLGQHPFLDYDESAYAVVTRETYSQSDSLLPFTLYFAHEVWIDKPPLYFWVSNMFLIFFEPELALRLFSSLSALGIIILTWFLVREITKRRFYAFFASFILVSLPAFIDAGRQAKQDLPVTFFILSAVFALIKAKQTKNPKWLVTIGLSIALGVLTKSIIGLLTIPLLLFFSLVDIKYFRSVEDIKQNFSWVTNAYFWLGNLLGLCLALPWHTYMYIRFGNEFIEKYVLTHVVKRYSTNLFQNDDTWYVYGYYLINYALPWIIIFFIILIGILFSKTYIKIFSKRNTIETEKDGQVESHYIPLFIASVASMAFITGLFSFSGTKAPYYLVPIYPFLAIAISSGLGFLSFSFPFSLSRRISVAHYLKILVCILLAIVFSVSVTQAYSKGFRLDPEFNYYTRTSYEEKEIGLLLAQQLKYENGKNIRIKNLTESITSGNDKYIPVLFYNDRYWETVRYYSNSLILGQYEKQEFEEFYLIIPNADFEIVPNYNRLKTDNNSISRNIETVYAGTYFKLLLISTQK